MCPQPGGRVFDSDQTGIVIDSDAVGGQHVCVVPQAGVICRRFAIGGQRQQLANGL